VAPPLEAQIIRQARLAAVPPWKFEDDCSEYWWNWILAYDAATYEASKK
jgi:hypothetical protein